MQVRLWSRLDARSSMVPCMGQTGIQISLDAYGFSCFFHMWMPRWQAVRIRASEKHPNSWLQVLQLVSGEEPGQIAIVVRAIWARSSPSLLQGTECGEGRDEQLEL